METHMVFHGAETLEPGTLTAWGKRIEGWEVQDGTCWVETSDGVRSDIVIYFTDGSYMYAKLVR